MKRRIVWLLPFLLVPAVVAQAATVEGVSFRPTYRAEGRTLTLHGAGLMRWKWVVKAYVAALYLDPGAQPLQVFDDVSKRLEIEYFHAIRASDFQNVTLDRIRLNVSGPEFERLRPRIEQLNRLYRDVAPGDRYALTYVPGRGTELAWNDRPLGVVPGTDLARALFAIWLGDVPVDASLKQALIGR